MTNFQENNSARNYFYYVVGHASFQISILAEHNYCKFCQALAFYVIYINNPTTQFIAIHEVITMLSNALQGELLKQTFVSRFMQVWRGYYSQSMLCVTSDLESPVNINKTHSTYLGISCG